MKTGFININKPSGEFSSAMVNRVKRLVHTPCGHMGTLDPMASGVLPIGIGHATRLFDLFLQKKKNYRAQFLFGYTSDTLDTCGELTKIGFVPERKDIEEVIPSLVGEVMQIPPKYSAKSVNGKRGYDMARRGEDFTLPPKKVSIERITLLSSDGDGKFSFEIECGGGTYIRSIARDMGEKLGSSAVMSALTRTKSGAFCIESSISPEILTKDNIEDYIIPTEDILPYPVLNCDNTHLFNGLRVKSSEKDGIYKAYSDEGFYGLAEVKDGSAKIITKLC